MVPIMLGVPQMDRAQAEEPKQANKMTEVVSPVTRPESERRTTVALPVNAPQNRSNPNPQLRGHEGNRHPWRGSGQYEGRRGGPYQPQAQPAVPAMKEESVWKTWKLNQVWSIVKTIVMMTANIVQIGVAYRVLRGAPVAVAATAWYTPIVSVIAGVAAMGVVSGASYLGYMFLLNKESHE